MPWWRRLQSTPGFMRPGFLVLTEGRWIAFKVGCQSVNQIMISNDSLFHFLFVGVSMTIWEIGRFLTICQLSQTQPEAGKSKLPSGGQASALSVQVRTSRLQEKLRWFIIICLRDNNVIWTLSQRISDTWGFNLHMFFPVKRRDIVLNFSVSPFVPLLEGSIA